MLSSKRRRPQIAGPEEVSHTTRSPMPPPAHQTRPPFVPLQVNEHGLKLRDLRHLGNKTFDPPEPMPRTRCGGSLGTT